MRVRAELRDVSWPVQPEEDGWPAPEVMDLWLAAAPTLADAVRAAAGDAIEADADLETLPVIASVDGRPVPAELWSATALRPGQALTLTIVPRGSVTRTVLQVAVIAAALYIPGPQVLALSGFSAAAAGAAISIGGSFLINTLIPPPVPDGAAGVAGGGGRGLTRERLTTSAAANRLRPWGRRTLILGDVRFEPDLLTHQIAAPMVDDTTEAVITVVDGASRTMHRRVDRVFALDLGIGDLRLYRDGGGAPVALPAAPTVLDEALLTSDSDALTPEWGARPGAAPLPPAALPASSRWPFLARSVDDTLKTLSGDTASIDRSRTAPTLHVVVGGSLWTTGSSGQALGRSTTVQVQSPASAEVGDAIDATVTLTSSRPGSAPRLDPVYAVLAVASTARDWTLTGGDRSTSASSRAELSVQQQVWTELESDLTDRRLCSNVLGVRLVGRVGAPPRSVLRARAVQAVATPTAAGVWTGAEPSRNPAAILRAFALGWYDADGALLAGSGRPANTVDDAVLAEWYRWCAAHDPPLHCDLALQDDGRPGEAIERLIAATGRAEISWRTGRLGVVWAGPNDAPEGLIHPSLILPGSLARSWSGVSEVDVFVASYLDRDRWEGREVRVAVPGRTSAARARHITLEGVTDRAAALFHTTAVAAEEAYHRRIVRWRMGRAGALVTRGSVWLLAWDPARGGASGRLRAWSAHEITLDRTVRPASQGWVALDWGDGVVHQSEVTTRSAIADPTDVLVLTRPVVVNAEVKPRDVIWRYYDLDRPPARVRILRAHPVSGNEFDITARVESDAYWRALDAARSANEVTPPPLPLPDPIRIDRPSDGSTVVWQWPASWVAAGVRATFVALSGGGGGGGSGGDPRGANAGQNGAVSRAVQGAWSIEARGGNGGGGPGSASPGSGGGGAAGGSAGAGTRGAGWRGASGWLTYGQTEGAPIRLTLGEGGAGGNGVGGASGGQRGSHGYAVLSPIR